MAAYMHVLEILYLRAKLYTFSLYIIWLNFMCTIAKDPFSPRYFIFETYNECFACQNQ